MSTVDTKLKYLFIAEYEGGEKYKQPQDDVSRLHKATPDFTPSSFRDVDQDRLVRFSLHEGDKEIVAVDLRTGLFTINGLEVDIAEQNFMPKEPRKLIYFREVRQEFTVGDDGEMNAVPGGHYINRYFIGWEAKDDKGRNHTQTLGVA